MTAYEMRISDWSSDVCSSYLQQRGFHDLPLLCEILLKTTDASNAELIDHGQIQAVILGRLDRQFVPGIGMPHDAACAVIDQHARQAVPRRIGTVGHDYPAGMLAIAHADAAPMVKRQPDRKSVG